MESYSTDEILDLIASGNKEAEACLYRRYRAYAYKAAAVCVKRRAHRGATVRQDIDDVVAEAFVRLFPRIRNGELDRNRPFEKHLWNTIDSWLRANASEKRLGSLTHSTHSSGDKPGYDPSDESPGPDEIIELGEQLEALKLCIATLDEASQLLLRLRYVNGLTLTAIADEITPPGKHPVSGQAIADRLRRIQNQLAACVREKLSEF